MQKTKSQFSGISLSVVAATHTREVTHSWFEAIQHSVTKWAIKTERPESSERQKSERSEGAGLELVEGRAGFGYKEGWGGQLQACDSCHLPFVSCTELSQYTAWVFRVPSDAPTPLAKPSITQAWGWCTHRSIQAGFPGPCRDRGVFGTGQRGSALGREYSWFWSWRNIHRSLAPNRLGAIDSWKL